MMMPVPVGQRGVKQHPPRAALTTRRSLPASRVHMGPEVRCASSPPLARCGKGRLAQRSRKATTIVISCPPSCRWVARNRRESTRERVDRVDGLDGSPRVNESQWGSPLLIANHHHRHLHHHFSVPSLATWTSSSGRVPSWYRVRIDPEGKTKGP
jgi:hypothetical protein